MRGSLALTFSFVMSCGIIPAGAGLTELIFDWDKITGDHPRGCGAHAGLQNNIGNQQGSSPRVRGSRLAYDDDGQLIGIIPAGAGLTRT